MAFDQNSLRHPVPSDAPFFHPQQPVNLGSSTADLADNDSRKVKLICSFGGCFFPRPSDGALRYVGGQTRIITLRRDAALSDLTRKLTDAFGPLAGIRYQLPGVDLDALVSVSSPEDLDNMMEEYDKLAESTPDGSAKLRVFLFSSSDLASDSNSSIASDFGDTRQRYVDAVNGISSAEADAVLGRKDSLVSVSSTQNSDNINEGTLMSPTVASAPHDPSRLLFVGGFPESLAIESAAQTLIPSRPEPPHYAPQAQVESRYIPAGSLPVNVVGVPSHSFVLPVQTPNSQMVSQFSSVKQVQPKVDPFSEENPNGGRVPQLHNDSNSNNKTLQPLSMLPPLPPSYMQPHNVEMYGSHQVGVIPPQQGQVMRMPDCYMCQKVLPHAHSDNIRQEHVNGVGGAAPELKPAFHSLHTEDAMKLHAPHRLIAGGLPDQVVDPNGESSVSTGQFGAYRFVPVPEKHHENNEKLVLPNAENFDHYKVLLPSGAVGMPSDAQASYGMFVNLPQSHHEDPLQQQQQQQQQQHNFSQIYGPHYFPVKQDGTTKPYGNGVYPVKTSNNQAIESLSRDYVPESSYEFVRPTNGMMGSHSVNPFETPGLNEQWKPIVNPNLGVSKEFKPEPPLLVVESNHTVRPSPVMGNTLLVGNPVINPGIVPDGYSVRPVDQLPASSLGLAQLHNLQPANTGQVSTSGTYLFNHETGVEHMVSSDTLRGMTTYPSAIDPAYNGNAMNRFPVGNWKDETSQVQPIVVPNGIAAHPSVNVPFPLPNSKDTARFVEQFQEPNQSESLFCNQDPSKILGSSHLLPLRPSRVGNEESVVPKVLGADNRLPNNKEEGGFHQQLNPLKTESCIESSFWPTKGSADDRIKQELQAVAEGVAESVLQSSISPTKACFASEAKGSVQSNNHRVIEDSGSSQSAAVLGDHRIEDIKTKHLDKLNHGFPVADDIGRLQIINNSDLEELRELGSGTFGTVYHGKWRGSDVAIKRINERCFAGKPSEEERMRADFWNEACKLADLHHPNVVAFYGVVLDGPEGSVATVTEYMVNGSLRQVLQKNYKILDHRKRLLIAMDVAFGMEYLHAKNIVHFDLKSDNLLVNLRDPQRPICKVGDLGLSKVKCQTLISGGVRGTLPWMAPELLNGSSSLVSEKVDVFSFGIVMWELLTGEEPYADLHYGQIIGGIVSNTLRPPVPEICDLEWRSLMEKCWSSEPSERPSFTVVANQLRSMAASIPPKGQPQP